jgi:hypothetical protein
LGLKPSAKQNNAFCFFFWKRRRLFDELVPWGHASKPPGSASPRLGYRIVFCEAEQRFLLLFPEKEENYSTFWYLEARSPIYLVGLGVESSLQQKNAFLDLFPGLSNHWFRLTEILVEYPSATQKAILVGEKDCLTS